MATSVQIFLNRTGYATQAFIDQRIHPVIYDVTGINMDDFQKQVHDSIPEFNYENAAWFILQWTVIWLVIIHASVMATPYLMSYASKDIRAVYDKASPFKRLMITCRAIYSPLHLTIANPIIIYGFIYADGKAGTSWFADEHYWETAFDYQKYITIWMFAYVFAETVYIFLSMDYDPKMNQVYAHHLISLVGCVPGIYFGGWVFSQNYLVCLSEITNPCNNIRGLLTDLEIPNGKIYAVNAIVWFISFLWFRTISFTYIIFTKTAFCIDGFACPDYVSGVEGTDMLIIWLCQLVSWSFWALNMVWTWQIGKGILVGAGLI